MVNLIIVTTCNSFFLYSNRQESSVKKRRTVAGNKYLRQCMTRFEFEEIKEESTFTFNNEIAVISGGFLVKFSRVNKSKRESCDYRSKHNFDLIASAKQRNYLVFFSYQTDQGISNPLEKSRVQYGVHNFALNSDTIYDVRTRHLKGCILKSETCCCEIMGEKVFFGCVLEHPKGNSKTTVRIFQSGLCPKRDRIELQLVTDISFTEDFAQLSMRRKKIKPSEFQIREKLNGFFII